jgi:Thrombospondin type 1 domain
MHECLHLFVPFQLNVSISLSLPQGVLFTFINTNNSNSDVSKTKSSSSSAPFHEENKELEDDEIQKRPSQHNKIGWSGWSDFSACSRTCDGGVAFQLRRCHSPSGCRGESVRYRICNMQACPDQQDFRAQQCAAFNEVPYDGAMFVWTPHYDYSEPCALTCR